MSLNQVRAPLYAVINHRWIGRWIIGVATIHMGFTFVLFPEQVKRIFSEGFFNTGLMDFEVGKTVWFFLFGMPLLLVGYMIDSDEKRKTMPPFREIPIILLFLMTLLGIALIPVSGLWLMLPALMGLIVKNKIANEGY
ncbi:DUF6463 family protein [Kiloniella sp.]|uniref:DUF6463 family protein n=1 Tax=Kiloniella sp. TaxID=1938587 RepID=UPI003B02E67D